MGEVHAPGSGRRGHTKVHSLPTPHPPKHTTDLDEESRSYKRYGTGHQLYNTGLNRPSWNKRPHLCPVTAAYIGAWLPGAPRALDECTAEGVLTPKVTQPGYTCR